MCCCRPDIQYFGRMNKAENIGVFSAYVVLTAGQTSGSPDHRPFRLDDTICGGYGWSSDTLSPSAADCSASSEEYLS